MNKDEFAIILIDRFPEYSETFYEHMKEYEKLLGHVFFGDIFDEQLFELLKNDRDEERIKAIFSFINDFYHQGDDDCKNIVIVTIMEYLGDDKEVLGKAYKYISDEMIEESMRNEKSLGRM